MSDNDKIDNNSNNNNSITTDTTTTTPVVDNNNNENKIDNNNTNNIKCTFKKPIKQRGNIRKRSDDLILNTTKNSDEQDDDDDNNGDEKDKKKLKSKINQYTTKQEKKNEFSYDSSGNAGSSINSAELSTTEYLNEEDEYQDKVIKNSSKSLNNEETNGSNDDGIYRGMKSYSTYVEKKSDLSYKGGGVKAGPIKTSTTFRLSSRIDHQPDVCKDYKQTGQCTFGDACKFLHDRTDYKSGWQIDKEYEEEQKQKRLNNIKGISSTSTSTSSDKKDEKDDSSLPFACFICKKQYNNPVQTKCKHFFCEDCALTHNRKNKKCALCGEPTGGTFTTPSKKIIDQLMEISKSHFSTTQN